MWCSIGILTIAIIAQTYVTRNIGSDELPVAVTAEDDGSFCVHVQNEEELRMVEMVLEAHRYRRSNRVNDHGTMEKFASRINTGIGY